VNDESTLPAPSLSTREQFVPLLLGLLAIMAVVVNIEPFPVGVYQDDGIYTVLAKSLATGQGFRYLHLPDAPNATHYPPLYPLFLAGLWKAFPSFPANITLFKFANAAFLGVAAFMAWRFARRQVGMTHWSAVISAGAFTICAPLVLHAVMVLSESMFLAALFPVLIACERAARTGDRRDALIAGAAAGALALVRTIGAVAIPATALTLAIRKRWVPAALVWVAGLAVMLPWQLWIATYDSQLPDVFLGRYGSYGGWLMSGIREGGIAWIGQLIVFNLDELSDGMSLLLTVDHLPVAIRWLGTLAIAGFFAGGWLKMLRRAPVAAWTVAIYLAVIISWPFEPPRFIFAVWPVIGMIMGLSVHAVLTWRPAPGMRFRVMQVAGVTMAAGLVLGYARYNYVGVANRWWSQTQAFVANRSRPMAEWVVANTPSDAVIATDDDVLMHLYTGRRTVPNFTFTPQEYMTPQTRPFERETLRKIVRMYDVDYLLTASENGIRAANGLVQANPPEAQVIHVFKYGAVFRILQRTSEGQ
jgi:hypothetical protein